LTLAYAGLLEPRRSGFGLLKSTFNAKISYASCLGLSPAILVQFTLEVRVAARNREKFTKTLYFGLQDHSRSSMLTFLRSSSPVFVMISSISVSICNHFYARRANNSRITPFKGVPFFLPLVRGDPLHPVA